MVHQLSQDLKVVKRVVSKNQVKPWVNVGRFIVRPRYGVWPLDIVASAACVYNGYQRPTIHFGSDPTLWFTAVAFLRLPGLD